MYTETLAGYQADDFFRSASNIKLLTSAVALKNLVLVIAGPPPFIPKHAGDSLDSLALKGWRSSLSYGDLSTMVEGLTTCMVVFE